MDTAYLNGSFLPKEELKISPDDRGFIFGDGVYEVMKWYAGAFYDPDSHLSRLKRSLKEIRVEWSGVDSYSDINRELVRVNGMENTNAIVYLQVTRGVAPRNHSFPEPAVTPTIYAFAKQSGALREDPGPAIPVMLTKDIRWSRCDIKSISLLANTLSFQEACEKGMKECIFVRDGLITEGSRSNIFLVSGNVIYTHPQSGFILPGITRKNVIKYAVESGITVKEEAFPVKETPSVQEAFICNSSSEITSVSAFGPLRVGDGRPGPVSRQIHEKFREGIAALRG